MDCDKPDAEFWRAILDIYNTFIDEVAFIYGPGAILEQRRSVYQSFMIVSWWLDIALTRDWLEESNS
jgi:hypothetical protein